MTFRQPDIEESHANRRKISAWVLIVLYGVVIMTLIFMIVASQQPAGSSFIETITQASCLSAETNGCQTESQFNAPFFIGLFVVPTSILMLVLKPWKPLSNRSYTQAQFTNS